MKKAQMPRLAASTSFSAREVLALEEVMNKLLRGADLRAMARSPELAGVMRKVNVMKAALERQRARRAAPREPVPEETRELAHDPACDVLSLGPQLEASTKPCNCGAMVESEGESE